MKPPMACGILFGMPAQQRDPRRNAPRSVFATWHQKASRAAFCARIATIGG